MSKSLKAARKSFLMRQKEDNDLSYIIFALTMLLFRFVFVLVT